MPPPNPSRSRTERLLAALRQEQALVLQLQRVVDEEQGQILRREPVALVGTLDRMERVGQQLATAGQGRKAALQDLASRVQRRPTDSMSEILRWVTPAERSQINGMVQDIQARFARCRRVLRQNHLLLTRALELQEALRRQLDPGQQWINSYNQRGQAIPLRARSTPRWENIV